MSQATKLEEFSTKKGWIFIWQVFFNHFIKNVAFNKIQNTTSYEIP